MGAVRDGSGNIVCASGGSCVPINLFGQNAFSSAAASYVLDSGQAVSENTQRVVTANLSGPLPFRLGKADPVSFNLGTEFRKEDASFEPGRLVAGRSEPARPDRRKSVCAHFWRLQHREYYTEVFAPLISAGENLAVVKSLSFEGALRYVDNSIAGGDNTWSTGARFAPRCRDGRWAHDARCVHPFDPGAGNHRAVLRRRAQP